MGVLDRFEKGIERAVNGAFAKAFRSEVQPVEIASALRRECDEKASVVGRDRTIAPNSFVVELGRADHERLGEWEAALGDELSAAVHEHARQQRYAFVGPVHVEFAQAEDLDTGVFRVRSTTVRPEAGHGRQGGVGGAGRPAYDPQGYDPQGYEQQGYEQGHRSPDQGRHGAPAADPRQGSGLPAAPPYPGAPPASYPPPAAPAAAPWSQPAEPERWGPPPEAPGQAWPPPAHPGADRQEPPGAWDGAPSAGVLEVDGRPHPVDRPVTVIGRALDADIVLDDPGVSRRHAEVHVVDGRARVIDLGSTNGTFVDGERVHAAGLANGSTITVGRTRITYRADRQRQW